MPAIGFEIKRKCKVCGEVFIAKTLDSLYCSPKCSKVAWKRKKRRAKEGREAHATGTTYSRHQGVSVGAGGRGDVWCGADYALPAHKEWYGTSYQCREKADQNQTLGLGSNVPHQNGK